MPEYVISLISFAFYNIYVVQISSFIKIINKYHIYMCVLYTCTAETEFISVD